VGTRQNADFALDRADISQATAVDAGLGLDDLAAHDASASKAT
jgi:hypothetical protein